jgi:hypothetical protein
MPWTQPWINALRANYVNNLSKAARASASTPAEIHKDDCARRFKADSASPRLRCLMAAAHSTIPNDPCTSTPKEVARPALQRHP